MTQRLNQNEYFKSSDLALCATLCYFGYSIESIDKTNPAKSLFLIKRDDKLDDLIKGFWSHQLKVEPSAFFNCIKELKNRIFNA